MCSRWFEKALLAQHQNKLRKLVPIGWSWCWSDVCFWSCQKLRGFAGRWRLLVAAGLEFNSFVSPFRESPPLLLIRHQSMFGMNKSRTVHVCCTRVYKCKSTPRALVPVHMYDVDLSIVDCRLPALLAAEPFLGSVHLLIHNHAYAYVRLVNSMYFWRMC